ncbi:MAG: ATP-grasp domain-containing protein [Bdellovibrio sp.]|nr:ATP-grasp domain-containing protein [Methylotenera sp.]
MIKLNKIFVCEFITGGGLCAEELPTSLVREGALMRDALLRDLSALPYAVYTTVDARLAEPAHCLCVKIYPNDDIWQIWQTLMSEADAVFLIAPETDGLLHYLTQLALLQPQGLSPQNSLAEAGYSCHKGKLVLGCGLDSILTTSDKMATYLALKLANINTINTFTADYWIEHEARYEQISWLAKPNVGAGCEATVRFNDAEDLIDWLTQNKNQSLHIIQPFQVGTPASISCVIFEGRAQLLSCNKQLIEINNHTLSFKGVLINGMREHWQAFEQIANSVAKTFPSLAGYVGIDVIVKQNKIVQQNEIVQQSQIVQQNQILPNQIVQNQILVVEINPRLTTSYAGLSDSIGVNPAELIINTLTQPNYQWPTLQQNEVTIHV